VVTTLIKLVTLTASNLLIKVKNLDPVYIVTMLLLAALICLNIFNNLAILDANAYNLSARVSNVYYLNEILPELFLCNIINKALRHFLATHPCLVD
jgi:hypothetical protein